MISRNMDLKLPFGASMFLKSQHHWSLLLDIRLELKHRVLAFVHVERHHVMFVTEFLLPFISQYSLPEQRICQLVVDMGRPKRTDPPTSVGRFPTLISPISPIRPPGPLDEDLLSINIGVVVALIGLTNIRLNQCLESKDRSTLPSPLPVALNMTDI